ncbi:hypothetical protein [Paenibacillus cremeus]|uniref:hypothetical protein n=1 Tax=Paenibacillus cremeus TaxID=2163881 RepID=UPI0016449B11|nr:hypothetical protein [Paenibacillus cremeus]
MSNANEGDIEQFLAQVHQIQSKVKHLIEKSDLSQEEKQFILENIIIIPVQKEYG